MTTAAPIATPFRRDRQTVGGYFALALFTFFLNIQGNVIPFLRDTFQLSYTLVSLHPAALATGLIVCGLIGDRIVTAAGRRTGIALSVFGLAGGAALFTIATTPILTIFGCFLLGCPGGLILVVIPALLSQLHGSNREIALSQANAVCYGASLMAALTMGLFVGLKFDWRSSLLLGIALAALFVFAYRTVDIAKPAARVETTGSDRLPAVYWLYWVTLFCVIALEQTTLLWAPEFLEKIQGLSRATAASAAADFSVGMMLGRLSGTALLGRLRKATVFYLSLFLTVPGFLLYWGVAIPIVGVAGLFLLGLGIALLYPVTLGMAIGSAGRLGEQASARASLASGLAILIVPMALGALADGVGLWLACLILPVLAAVSAVTFRIARRLDRHA